MSGDEATISASRRTGVALAKPEIAAQMAGK